MERPDFLSKIDVSPIIKGHLETLVDARTGKTGLLELTLFFGSPAILGLSLDLFRFGFRIDAVSGFLNAFAILTGLMLNLLVLVFSLSTSPDKANYQIRRIIVREVFANVCYCILIAIGVVGTTVVDLGYMRSNPGARSGPISTFLLAFLTAHFLICLLMVMKRMYRLITNEFEVKTGKKAA